MRLYFFYPIELNEYTKGYKGDWYKGPFLALNPVLKHFPVLSPFF